MVNLKIYDVTDWTVNNSNTHITQYLKNQLNERQSGKRFGQLVKYSVGIIFFKYHTENEVGRVVSDFFLLFKKLYTK